VRNYYFNQKNEADKLEVNFSVVDDHFIDLYDMELTKGQKFSEEFTTDQVHPLIINETAAKMIGFKEPIGRRSIFDSDGNEYEVIGIIKDFHFKPLHQEIEPLFMTLDRSETWMGYISIKVSPENFSQTLAFMEKKFREFSPDYPFNYSFLDESIDAKYKSEQKIGHIFDYFTLIAVFIACLGLLGLSSFTTERRTKEIGIRKTLGASASIIFALLSKDFVKWILAANILAWPVAYFAMTRWLQNYAYRIEIGIWMFFLSGLIALVIAMVTMSYAVIKAARANPVDSLRYE
jgi:putative ABC transport system permease protein